VHVKLETGNLPQIRSVADRSIEALKATGLQDEDISILAVLENFLAKNSVRIQSWDLGERIVALHLYEPNTNAHFIGISSRLLKIQDVPTRRMATKRLFCHELSHMLFKHPAAFHPPEGENGAAFLNAYKALMQFASDPAIHSGYENEAEIFSAALGFWPLNKFMRLFRNSKGDFRQVANEFKMPIDCAVKWALITTRLPMHYLKYNATQTEVEDFFVPSDTDYELFPWGFKNGDVFKQKETTAYRCLDEKEDISGVTTTKQDNREAAFFCRAFYQSTNEALLRIDEKVVVAGFPKPVADNAPNANALRLASAASRCTYTTMATSPGLSSSLCCFLGRSGTGCVA
jgi:hypothetical protein